MSQRIRTLLLVSNGSSSPRAVAADTLLQGLLQFDRRTYWQRFISSPSLRSRLTSRYETLSYIQDWQEAFLASPLLDVDVCNLLNMVDVARAWRKMPDYDLVVALHSAIGDDLRAVSRVLPLLQGRRGRMLALVGNEYVLMPEKIGFLNAVGADFVGSQLPLDAANWLYSECARTTVLPAPHALNASVYQLQNEGTRPVDLGFIGDLYPWFIGDIERTKVIELFEDCGRDFGLHIDFRRSRLARREWVAFLNQAKGIVGAESGTYYLERDDRSRRAVEAFLSEHPDATFADVHARFFKELADPVNGKAISSRHFEPIGTGTCQILLEGHYNGILQPDEHYLSLRKDHTNLPDVIERFKDTTYRSELVRRTREYVLAEHTYGHRVTSLITQISGDL